MKDSIKFINLNSNSIELPRVERKGFGNLKIIRWGNNNNFSQELINLVNESPLQKSIINSLYLRLCGANINIPDNLKTPNFRDSWDSLVKKCMKDFSIFQAFSLQLVLNKDGEHFSIYHQPVSEIRFEQVNPNNEIEFAYICTDWSKMYNYSNVERIKLLSTDIKRGEKYLIYFKQYEPQEYYYHTPSYFSAANWINADAKLSRYYNNFISNNFNSQKILYYPSEPSKEEKDELYKNIKANFTGEDNAGSILVLYGSSNELMPRIESIPSSDAELYNNVTDLVSKYIISANSLTSPVLAGLSTSSGFSSKSEEIIAAETCYKLNVVKPQRMFVLDSINNLIHNLNQTNSSITIDDYNLTEEYEGDTTNNNNLDTYE